MSDDSTKQSGDANSGKPDQERRGDPDIRARSNRDLLRDFNLPVEYGERIAALSPEARKSVEVMIQHGNDRLEREALDQRRSHKFRVLSEENNRLKEVLRHPDLKLGEMPFAGQAEIDHIEDMAKSTVNRREQSYRDTIRDETKYSIDREIGVDAERQKRGLQPEAQRDEEHER